MADMGRRRTTHHGLPPHMGRKGKFYYYVTNERPRRWIALGEHYGTALREWAALEGKPIPESARTLTQIAEFYRKDEIPKKAPRTQKDNESELKRLEAVFGDSPLETIRSVDVARYLAGRADENGRLVPIRANREISLLSHLINYARRRGFTEMANPCAGIQRNKETGRERYMDDAEFDAIYGKADVALQDAMDLLLLTAQRPADVLKMKRTDVKDGCLWVRQGKTGAKLRIDVTGDLAAAIERMNTRTRKATGVYLVQDDAGQPLTYTQLEWRFRKARTAAAVADVQLRDLRAKAATDSDDLAHAQDLLGHKTRAMTERYVKTRIGQTVSPLRRKSAK